jgi:hypothetical protein
MGGMRDLTSGPGLLAGERREREREGAGLSGAARARAAGPLGPWEERGEAGGGAVWAGSGPAEGGRVFPFSFSVFYFTFPFSIFVTFYFLFFWINNLLNNLKCWKKNLCEVLLTIKVYAYDEMT